MSSALRVVFDTNVLISALLSSRSAPSLAFARMETEGILLASQATIAELEVVLARPKFDRVLSRKTRDEFLRRYRLAAELVAIAAPIQVCRDARDDKFLELAVSGNARFLVTGDEDLRILHPFQGVAILAPQEFIDAVDAARKASEK